MGGSIYEIYETENNKKIEEISTYCAQMAALLESEANIISSMSDTFSTMSSEFYEIFANNLDKEEKLMEHTDNRFAN